MPGPTPTQISALYKSTLSASKQFASYNFRNYFILRTNSHFKTPGPPAVVAGSEKELVSWYNARVKELEVLRRSAVINRIYEGPRLVVEKDVEEIQEEENETVLEHLNKPGDTNYHC